VSCLTTCPAKSLIHPALPLDGLQNLNLTFVTDFGSPDTLNNRVDALVRFRFDWVLRDRQDRLQAIEAMVGRPGVLSLAGWRARAMVADWGRGNLVRSSTVSFQHWQDGCRDR
jgi:hypothetical protein